MQYLEQLGFDNFFLDQLCSSTDRSGEQANKSQEQLSALDTAPGRVAIEHRGGYDVLSESGPQ